MSPHSVKVFSGYQAFKNRPVSTLQEEQLPAACQQFMPPLGLRISAVFDLQPAGCVVLVNADFSLCYNPLKVAGANFREKALPALLDVLRIKEPGTLRGLDESGESFLSFDKGPLPQILAIEPQGVECVQHRLPFPAEQLVELAHALRIEANDFAVNDGVLHGQLGQRPLECLKS